MSVRRMNLKRSRSSASSSDRQPIMALGKANPGHDPIDYDDIRVGAEIQMTAAASGVVPDDTFTVSQAVNALGFGKFQIILSFVTGLCWMADSMEIMILSILSPALHCQWGVSQYNQAFLTTVVFVGMMSSSLFWGKLADKFGRRQTLILAGAFLFFYGILSAFAPSYKWVLFLRFLVGFNIGCVPQSVTLLSEFLPTRQRAKCVVLLDCFWALGACAEVLLAAAIMPVGGWRWLLALSAFPSLAFVAAAAAWVPESARFNAARGETDLALDTLERVASENKQPMLLGRLTVDATDAAAAVTGGGSFSDLLSSGGLRRTTLSLWLIWSSCSFVYYGVLLMTTEMFETPGDDICGLDGSLMETCSAQCSPLDRVDYGHLLWTTLAEFPGILLTISLVERLGRKRTLAAEFLALTVALCSLFKCTANRLGVTVVLFVIRGIASGVFQAAYVYTPEVYPTVLRAVGVGSCSLMARAGAILTPYVAQVLMKSSLSSAVGVYVGASFLAAVVCYSLPVETQGQDLGQQQNTTNATNST